MNPIARDELIIMRHAPADHGGRLCGRTDVAACLPEKSKLEALRSVLGGCQIVSSPARRCIETAEAIFPGRTHSRDTRLWEQDFGAHEALPFSKLPDIGQLTLEALADYKAEGGESFLDMVSRVEPALRSLSDVVRASGPILVVAHAGTARSALGLALGEPAFGLKFEIEPLSLTRFRCLSDGLSVIATNEPVGA